MCFQDENKKDVARIDLCPGYGTWRIQKLEKNESIVGLHSYIEADDEKYIMDSVSASGEQSEQTDRAENEVED